MNSLDPSVLGGPLTPAPELAERASEDGSIHRVSQFAHRGDDHEAARQAATLIADQVYDIRLLGYYFYGLFLERGLTYLPALLIRVRELLERDYGALAPERKKERVVDASLQWLFQSIDTRLRFHAEFGDETWQRWLSDGDGDLSKELLAAQDGLQRAVAQRLDEPRCGKVLVRLKLWVERDLARALMQQRAAAAPANDVGGDDEAGGDGGGGVVASVPQRGEESAAARTAPLGMVGAGEAHPPEPLAGVASASAAMKELIQKMEGFCSLVERGSFARAAVVAQDISRIIESFDPVTFLPKLFAPYFRHLNQAIEEITPYWDMMGSPSWQAQEQYYRADIDAFLDDE
ncbi:type VI secretion system protein IglI family protein [Haliangium ochraceum]|uniref:ImpA N-terminal domain-containing protein n=1 Tax=Haliangium ochraceum (strain DSM 14365 / JCM 11303 / SMP-2) TaxID=502025 RepID=D0LR38_HALO1|nr:type VI secretion system protein IglI family protein [Haliangium ochraceum]ACY15546.1 hypothetical protein Hoch_3040 [Haliangium ochraceum DSM 14365]